MSRNSVFQYKGKETNAQAAGHALGVRAVLTGSLLQRGDNLSISIELVDARDNSHILGQQYSRKVADILSMQTEIARDISERLRLRLAGADEKGLTRRYTENTEAYQLYLKGRFYWNKRTREAYKKAIELFNQALEKDPNYALAYSGLADCYSLGDYPLPPKEKYPLARQAALKALELDDTLAESHAALGRIKQEYDWDREGAEKEFKRAIELNPNSSLAHMRYAAFFSYLGKHEQAIAESKQTVVLDPLSALMNWDLAFTYYWARRYDESIEQDLKTLEIDPNYIRSIYEIGLSYEQKGMFEKAFEQYLKMAALEGNTAEIMALKEAYAASGVRGYYRKQLDLEMAKAQRNEYNVAALYARLDDKDRAVEWLQKGIEQRSGDLVYLKIAPAFDNMRSDPGFIEIMKRVGLAP
jgi:tetratricopeptide (TPR) repeat protein